ncbi:MAG: hypothetical protein R3283_06225 [Balneolaceae bacterium]|nr:hypothetical protein [Balneolaceae bacterium]
MNQPSPEDNILSEFILEYTEGSIEDAVKCSFEELMNSDCHIQHAVNANKVISFLLGKMPQIGVSDKFDRKMAAAFAIELEKEVENSQKQRLSRSNSNELIR